ITVMTRKISHGAVGYMACATFGGRTPPMSLRGSGERLRSAASRDAERLRSVIAGRPRAAGTCGVSRMSCADRATPQTSIRQPAQQVIDAGLAARALVDLLDDHRAIERMRAVPG